MNKVLILNIIDYLYRKLNQLLSLSNMEQINCTVSNSDCLPFSFDFDTPRFINLKRGVLRSKGLMEHHLALNFKLRTRGDSGKRSGNTKRKAENQTLCVSDVN